MLPYFTFHSGYIPMRTPVAGGNVATNFTFHSGYIPILLFEYKNNTSCTLHSILDIFQFYPLPRKHSTVVFTFHSGYIPILQRNQAINYTQELYIPFWIYSNSSIASTKDTTALLYIPFWIYSNVYKRSGYRWLCCFTFHSGYIPIKIVTKFSVKTVYFTFHSGYIPIVQILR